MFEKRRELAEEEHQAGRGGGPLEAFGIQGRKQGVPGGGWVSGHCCFFFFLKSFIYFNWRINCFRILWLFLPYINMNLPLVYVCPPHPEPLPLPSPLYPSRLSQSTGFGWAPLLSRMGLRGR